VKEIIPRDGLIPGWVLIRILKASGYQPTFSYKEKKNEQRSIGTGK
jgi:hypothetical protein